MNDGVSNQRRDIHEGGGLEFLADRASVLLGWAIVFLSEFRPSVLTRDGERPWSGRPIASNRRGNSQVRNGGRPRRDGEVARFRKYYSGILQKEWLL